MLNFSFLTFVVLCSTFTVNCTPHSIQEYIFPSTPCLVHFVLHNRQNTQVLDSPQNHDLEFDYSIFRNFIFLSSSFMTTNISTVNQEQDEDEVDDGQSSASSSSKKSLLIESKWRGGQCFRFFVVNSPTFLDIFQDPQLMAWKGSETPEIIAFVSNKPSPGWTSESIIASKEADDFNGFRANLVICVWMSDEPSSRSSSVSISFEKLGFLCYICPEEASIHWVEEPLEHNVMKIYKKLKRNGHNRKLFLKYGNDLTNYEEDRNCEVNMFFQKTKDCGITTVLLQMTKAALNITVVRVLDLEDVDSPISTNAIILGEIPSDMTSLDNGQVSLFFRDQTIGKLFYCTDSEKFEPVSWNFFFRVVEPLVWAAIFLLGIVYAIIARSPYLGIRALLFLVGQGIPSQLSRKKVLLTPLLPLILVSNWYISILTMDVVVPPAIWVVTKNKELFDLGFKFLIPSLSALPVIRQRANKSLEKFGIAWDPNCFIARNDIIQFGQELQPEFFIKLGAVNGIYHTNVDMVKYMRRLKLLNPRSSRYGNVTCSVVEEVWDDQIKYFWFVGGYLSPQFVEIASRFVESGFNYFWTAKKHLNTVSNMQISKYCQAHTQVCGMEDVKTMAMDSSIQIIFYFLLFLAIISILIFGVEVMYQRKHKIVSPK